MNEFYSDYKDTDTEGKHSYVVALCSGGVMEDVELHYSDYQIIHANTKREAEAKYNEINRCSYFYGKVMKQL